MKRAVLIWSFALAGCTGNLPSQGTLPTVDGRNVGNVDAATVGGIKSAEILTSMTATGNATDANTPASLIKRDASGNFSAGTVTANVVGNVSGNLTGNASSASWAIGKEGANLPSSANLDVGNDGDYFVVTGTTDISAMSARQPGARVTLQFASTLVLHHNSTSLALAGGGNFKVYGGDTFELVSTGNGTWREVARHVTRDSDAYVTNSGLVGASVPLAALIRLRYDTVLVDTQGEWDTTASVFVAHQAGVYQITASYHTDIILWTQPGYCQIGVAVVGGGVGFPGTYTRLTFMPAINFPCFAQISATMRLRAGDVVQIQGYTSQAVSTGTGSIDQSVYAMRITRVLGP